MGKSTISMVMFNSYVKLPEGISGESGWTSTGGPTVGVAVAVMRLVNSGSNHPRKKRVNRRSSSQGRMYKFHVDNKKNYP